MKISKLLFLIASLFFVLSASLFATPTEVPTYAPTTAPTEIPAVVNDLIATRTVIAFPNPAKASDDITVAYKAKTGVMIDKAEIEIYTMNGDRVAKVTETTDRNGIVKFPLSKFAPGLYLYKVTVSYADGSKDSHKLKKFVVVR
jgi:hypothetical protein